MARKVPEGDLDEVLAVLPEFPEGASVQEIKRALGTNLPRRILPRRLALLVEHKPLVIEGRARASRYRLPKTGDAHAVLP